MNITFPIYFSVLITSIALSISNGQSQEQPTDIAAQPATVVPADQPARGDHPTVSHAEAYPSLSVIWALMGIIGFLSLATVALALYNTRLTKLRLNSNSGGTISFGDSVSEWMQNLEEHWKRSQQLQSESAAATLSQLKEVNAAFDTQGKNHFQQLVQAFQ